MKHLLNCLLVFFSLTTFGQTIISGKLLDDQQKPIPNVSVSYKKVGEVALLGFSKTEQNGTFKLQIKLSDVDSIQLDFNHMSYAKKSVVVVNRTASYAYTLETESRKIEEVNISNRPIFRRKDTINYNVGAFTSKNDRVIADIIKKLPGVEMNGGQILYQGKPIKKYMVNNLDLMEGRYGMINNNLPADAVKNVQIVENDQPIKILDSLVFSDQASLNLELKKFTSTGTGKVSLGLSPFLWDLNLTPMTFGKTFQMLNSFQTNNVGNDVAKNLRAFYTGGGYFSNDEVIKDGPSYISIRNVTTPGFDEKKWLDNKIFLISSNMLKKLENGLEIKGNISFYDDTQRRAGYTATEYFAADQTILNTEAIDNRYRINVLDAGVLVEKNKKEIFLRNRFSYHKRWNTDIGELIFNGTDNISQKRMYTDEAIQNSLSMARLFGKQLVNIRSVIEYHNTPQRLAVLPGQFQDLLNQGFSFDEMNQHVLYSGLRWDNNLSFLRKFKKWTFSPNIGLNYNRSNLETYISKTLDGSSPILTDGYLNDMLNSQLNLSLNLRISYENQKWKFNLTNPYNIYYFNVIQQEVKTLNNDIRNTFNPSASLTYLMNRNNEISTNLSMGKNYGGLDNFYNGYIISNYRSIQRYDARLLRTDNRNIGMTYIYKNALKANFGNANYSFFQSKRDYMFATLLDSAGRATTSITDQQSVNEGHKFTAGVSRFFSSSKTIVKLNGTVEWSNSDYLLNGKMDKQKTLNRSGSLEIINNYSSLISGEYKTTLGYLINKFSGESENLIFSNNHYVTIVIYPHKQHMFYLVNSLYRNNIQGQKDQFFSDATYRYTLKKWKTDIELTAQNLFNNHQYITQSSSNYELVESYFELRPRQFLLSTSFRF